MKAAWALMVLAAAARAEPGISAGQAGVMLALNGADLRLSIERLATVTATRVQGLERLPARLPPVRLHAAVPDARGAWQALLDPAGIAYALACDGQGCRLWLAGQGGPAVAAAARGRTAVPAADDAN